MRRRSFVLGEGALRVLSVFFFLYGGDVMTVTVDGWSNFGAQGLLAWDSASLCPPHVLLEIL